VAISSRVETKIQAAPATKQGKRTETVHGDLRHQIRWVERGDVHRMQWGIALPRQGLQLCQS
jgi:hypothetical protein